MSALLKQYFKQEYPTIDRGKGVWLWDIKGNKYLDGSSGAMTANIGHGVTEIADVLHEQASKVAFAFRNQFTNEPAEQLAKDLVELADGNITHAFFVNSGSEATEYAMRIALQYWQEKGQPQKAQFISRDQSYHGATIGALSLSGHPTRKADIKSMLHVFPTVPSLYTYHLPQNDQEKKADEWEHKILEIGASNIAAVIVEPITGAAGGALVAPEGYYRKLKEICDKHDVLLIFDEVITGMGRTGAWFAFHDEGVEPDLITTAKGLTAGYSPVGSILVTERIVETIQKGSGMSPGGHTFSCNPLGTATCLAVLNFIKENNLIDNVRKRAPELKAGLEKLTKKHPFIANVRGRGLLWGFDLISQNNDVNVSALTKTCQANGLLIYPSGIPTYNQAAMIAPPLVISASEIEELLQLLD